MRVSRSSGANIAGDFGSSFAMIKVMIYLIGGTPRSGKTTLAMLLSKKLKISWIPTDTIELMVQSYTPREEFPKRFPKSIIRQKTNYSNDTMYEQFTTKQIANAYIRQSRAVWKTIEKLVEAELKEGRSYILEGYHIHPRLVAELRRKFGSRNIKSVFLAKFDIGGIVETSRQFTSRTDWFVNKTKNMNTYPKVAAMIRELGNYSRKEAKKYNLKMYNMDMNFKRKQGEALRDLQGD